MSPPLPRAPSPMMRPGFAAGEEVDSNMLIAEQGAREGISPPEMATQRIKQYLGETGRTVSDRDAELYGMGMLTLEDIIDRAEPVTNRDMDFMTANPIDEVVVTGKMPDRTSTMGRNLRQQEQMFFPEKEKSFRDFQRVFKGGRLGDVLSYIPDQMQVADYMNYKREEDSKMKDIVQEILEDLEKKN